MKSEPAQIIGWLTAIVAAVITLLIAFGVQITADQRTAVLGLLAAIAPVVAAYAIRSQVTPTAKATAVVAQALQTIPPATDEQTKTMAKDMLK